RRSKPGMETTMSIHIWSRSFLLVAISSAPSCAGGVTDEGPSVDSAELEVLTADEAAGDGSSEIAHDSRDHDDIDEGPAGEEEVPTAELECELSITSSFDPFESWIYNCWEYEGSSYGDKPYIDDDLPAPSAVSGSGSGRVLHVRR